MSSRVRTGRADSISGQPPRRQVNACLRCYEKKVKCDMERSGQPCSGCVSQGVECQKRSRKPYPQRKESATPAPRSTSMSVVSDTSSIADNNKLPTPPRSIPSEPLPTPSIYPEHFDFSSSFADPTSVLSSSFPHHGPAFIPMSSPGEDTAMTGTMPFFSGDQQGYGYLLDICDAGRDTTTQHYFIPQGLCDTIDPDALAYAEAKGCFSIPNQSICDDLVQCYFHYVHPMLPIVDIAEFMEQYTEGGFQRASLLLLWSMFSVAVNFIPDNTLSRSGCKSRQELKGLMYSRAKCLYDIGYEQDKITLIQSSLLLGFWYSDLQDHTQSWHWTGVAISMAEAIGLHRNPDSRHINSAISMTRRRLWANIWWSCVFRDRWLSFGYGRPLRVNADDCDVPMPGLDCMLELGDRSPKSWHRYLPADLSQIAPIWLGLLQLSVVLGEILTANYQPRKSPLSAPAIEQLERRIGECLPDKQAASLYNELLLFFESSARLHVESTIIALYRPFASEFIVSRAAAPDSAVCKIANMRIRAAATRASGILDRIISTDTLRFAGPMMVPLLVPAMTIHLLQARSHDHFTSSWSRNRLELSLLVLKRLAVNYPAATLVYELFSQAKEKNTLPFGLSSQMSPTGLSNMSMPSTIGDGNWVDLGASIGCSQQWPSPDYKLNGNMSPLENIFFPLEDLNRM